MQVASACFIQPPLCYVGMTEEEAKQKLSGDIDVFVSKFKPLKNTLSGRDEKTLMKLIVHVPSDTVTFYILPAASSQAPAHHQRPVAWQLTPALAAEAKYLIPDAHVVQIKESHLNVVEC